MRRLEMQAVPALTLKLLHSASCGEAFRADRLSSLRQGPDLPHLGIGLLVLVPQRAIDKSIWIVGPKF